MRVLTSFRGSGPNDQLIDIGRRLGTGWWRVRQPADLRYGGNSKLGPIDPLCARQDGVWLAGTEGLFGLFGPFL